MNLKEQESLWEKEKMLVNIIFSFFSLVQKAYSPVIKPGDCVLKS